MKYPRQRKSCTYDEPSEDGECARLRVFGIGDSRKKIGAFTPVGCSGHRDGNGRMMRASIEMIERRTIPGNSVKEVGERMKGGAVSEDRSPENEAMLISGEKWVALDEDWHTRFQERRPASALSSRYSLGRS